ncbi:MAG: hypothetical protein M3Z24_09990, partial [Chloroflexota bacterium]|nr:hypothetical protein [Chloroflexota bacterium]
MTETRYPVSQDASPRLRSSRFFFCLLIGLALTVVLSLLEIALFWFLNPYHVDSAHRLSSLATLLTHLPWLWLLPLVELVGGTLIALGSIRPLALRGYTRAVQKADEQYGVAYTPFHSLTNTDFMPVAYAQDT